MWLDHGVMSLKDAHGMANSVDPDQTAPLGLHCLPNCSKTEDHYSTMLKF